MSGQPHSSFHLPLHAQHERDQFAPPAPPGRRRAVALAVLAHLVLIGALTWGVNWQTSADQPAVEAELWAAVPQQAAPRAAEPPPAPAPTPSPAPAPAPTPAPPPPAPAPPPPKAQPDTHEADIAIEREKKRLQEEKKRLQQLEQDKRDKAERERHEQEKKERLAEQKAQQEQAAKDKAAKEKAAREKAEKAKAAQEKAEQAKKLAEKKRQEQADAKRAAEFRDAQMRRIAGLAGATGAENASGNALRNASPSGGYGGKVAAKVKPNIVYPDVVSGNPRAEVEVHAAPDGTITSARILHSSGNKAWDDAVVRALYRTETLPRDVDGRVPPSLVIGFRPKD